MKDFYIEFRFQRYPKVYLKGLINELAHKFRVKGALRYRPVPHMTLYGPAQVRALDYVLIKIEKVAKMYTLIPFSICDFDWHDGKDGKVIACLIDASPELKNLRRQLAKELNRIIEIDTRKSWDSTGNYWFHSTIAMSDIDQRFGTIWSYVSKKEKPQINQYMVRITVLNSKREIEREYDLLLQRWLNRSEALDKRLLQKTVNRLRELQGLPPEKPTSFMALFRKLFD